MNASEASRGQTLWTKIFPPRLLGRLSGGRGGRAVLVLIGFFLAPVLVCAVIWLIGLIPIFGDARWIPGIPGAVFAVLAILWLFYAFGWWGTGTATAGGDQFDRDFSLPVAFGLGWLRLFLQIVMVGGCVLVIIAVWMDLRPWRLLSTPEIDALPARAASMPIPADWKPTGTETGDDSENPAPNGYYQRRYDVPAGYTFERMRTWLTGPQWADDPDGDSFGALEMPHCDADSGHCRAELRPVRGSHPEYVVDALYSAPLAEGETPEIRLRLEYAEYDPGQAPEAELTDETRARAALIPIPATWHRYNASADTSDNGENFVQSFDLPRSYTGRDLKAWLAGPSWTHPATGPAFGKIRMSYPCRHESDHYLCSMIVASTERGDDSDGPVESLLVTYQPDDHTVTVDFERNG